MSVQTAVKQGGQTASVKHLNRCDKTRKNANVSDKTLARSAHATMDLTNGDPPALMLWGSDE